MTSAFSKYLFTAVFMGACTSTDHPDYRASEVIETMGDIDKPEWALSGATMTEEEGDVIFISELSMGANSRPEACFKASELQGKSQMIGYIKSKITSSAQLNETNAESNPGFESLTAVLSQGTLSGVKTKDRFWEKRVESSETGERLLKIHCTVKLAIAKGELARQLREASMAASGGNAEMKAKLLKAQETFIENIGKE